MMRPIIAFPLDFFNTIRDFPFYVLVRSVSACVFERERECVHAFVCTIGVFVRVSVCVCVCVCVLGVYVVRVFECVLYV